MSASKCDGERTWHIPSILRYFIRGVAIASVLLLIYTWRKGNRPFSIFWGDAEFVVLSKYMLDGLLGAILLATSFVNVMTQKNKTYYMAFAMIIGFVATFLYPLSTNSFQLFLFEKVMYSCSMWLIVVLTLVTLVSIVDGILVSKRLDKSQAIIKKEIICHFMVCGISTAAGFCITFFSENPHSTIMQLVRYFLFFTVPLFAMGNLVIKCALALKSDEKRWATGGLLASAFSLFFFIYLCLL
jgi:hypothetical protein